jgi:hypothetical protein
VYEHYDDDEIASNDETALNDETNYTVDMSGRRVRGFR